MKFNGYLRKNGAAGTRNHVLVLSCVSCANHVSRKIADAVKGAVCFCHDTGCTQMGTDLEQTQRTLAGAGKNPNAGAVVVVSLGCEGVSAEKIVEEIKQTGKPVELVRIQTCGGTSAATAKGIETARAFRKELDKLEKTEIDASRLVLGLECGGSDFTSGIVSNPLVGYVADKLVKLGGTVILSETTEMIGAEHLLAARACCPEVADKLLAAVENVEQQAKNMNEDLRGSQPTPGNIEGGLSTIEEKSLGCLAKAGSTVVNEMLEYAQIPTAKGLVIMDTPGYDVESVTGMLAGGAQVVLFTTGRGTPVGSPTAPVIKITGNAQTAQRMAENIDFDASPVLEGKESLEEAGEKLFELLMRVVNGEQSCAEKLGHCESAITRKGPSF